MGADEAIRTEKKLAFFKQENYARKTCQKDPKETLRDATPRKAKPPETERTGGGSANKNEEKRQKNTAETRKSKPEACPSSESIAL